MASAVKPGLTEVRPVRRAKPHPSGEEDLARRPIREGPARYSASTGPCQRRFSRERAASKPFAKPPPKTPDSEERPGRWPLFGKASRSLRPTERACSPQPAGRACGLRPTGRACSLRPAGCARGPQPTGAPCSPRPTGRACGPPRRTRLRQGPPPPRSARWPRRPWRQERTAPRRPARPALRRLLRGGGCCGALGCCGAPGSCGSPARQGGAYTFLHTTALPGTAAPSGPSTLHTTLSVPSPLSVTSALTW